MGSLVCNRCVRSCSCEWKRDLANLGCEAAAAAATSAARETVDVVVVVVVVGGAVPRVFVIVVD